MANLNKEQKLWGWIFFGIVASLVICLIVNAYINHDAIGPRPSLNY
jgi:hypothetical protein